MTFNRVKQSQGFGTVYQGLITIKYSELCAIFGPPDDGTDDGKVQADWTINIAEGVIATIYDYKEEIEPRQILQWHIGGKTKDVVQLIDIIVKEYRKNNK
jgi:hypothetical protein